MNSSGSGKKLEGFLTGKGFYIVLFLCAAVIGVSAWMMAAGNETMTEDVKSVSSTVVEPHKVETVIVPPQEEEVQPVQKLFEDEPQEEAPVINDSGLADAAEQAEAPEAAQEATAQEAPAVYVWPVTGELERAHSTGALKYDVTMGDWRTHNGIDILAPLGSEVSAARAGTVESVVEDDLYGTVVTIDHGDGVKTVYANLDETTAVSAGDRVDAGSAIGAVGGSALCEVSQQPHLHFAVTVNGSGADPLSYLPD